MAPTGPGERAIVLPGFRPDAASLHALSASGDLSRAAVRADPALLFFLLTRNIPFSADRPVRPAADDLRGLADLAADPAAAWVDWRDPAIRPVSRTALAAAHFAELVADAAGTDLPRAWAGGWLAYAGWLAVGVSGPTAVADCLTAPDLSADPFGTQARTWGLTRAEIAWRLATSWPLPRWAAVLMGRLDCAPDEAARLGGDGRLQAVVQTAVVLAEQAETRLYVADEFDLAAALGELGLRSADLDRVRERYAATADPDAWLARDWADPRRESGLIDRLRVGAHRGPHAERAVLPHAERADHEEDRLRDAKLAAVAEFAAGASHEINNPLAVISGHGQYLLKQETDDDRRKALVSIVRQTRRIHALLTELMYFARPPAPKLEWVELSRLVREASAAVAALAADRGVAVQLGPVTAPLWVDVDPRQLTVALAALIRNGVEAAPPGGWVRVTTAFRPDRVDVAVEDSGPGPDGRSQAHLFDPFYSGRAAGRGRGLGLPAAWRLAREHGGDVRYAPTPGGPTRFVLSLPASAVVTGAQRKSA